MIGGTVDVAALAARAPRVADLHTEPLTLVDADVFKVSFELGWEGYQVLLPPALIPTNPPYGTWLIVRAPESPYGAFALAQLQIGSRAGSASRGFVFQTFVDGDAGATRALGERWGIAAQPGQIRLHRQYDAVEASVVVDGRPVLDVVARDALVLSAPDVSFNALMSLAHTPLGLRLIDVDLQVAVHQAERLKPSCRAFDAAAWGDTRIRPANPIAASAVLGDVTLPALRYVCDPLVSALDGVEAIPEAERTPQGA
jgi:hypothetical protein